MTELARTYPFLWVDVYIQFIYHRPDAFALTQEDYTLACCKRYNVQPSQQEKSTVAVEMDRYRP